MKFGLCLQGVLAVASKRWLAQGGWAVGAGWVGPIDTLDPSVGGLNWHWISDPQVAF